MSTAHNLPALPAIEPVVGQLLWDRLNLQTPAERDRVDRDLTGTPLVGITTGESLPWFVRIIKVSGTSDRFGGDFVLDIETFAEHYLLADSLASGIDALLLGYPHTVEVDAGRVVIDAVSQNVAPHEIPWGDEVVTRILATYVFTVRR